MSLHITRKAKTVVLLNLLCVPVGLAGCAVASSKSNPSVPVLVEITPTAASVPVSGNQQFDALMQNDGKNQGVTWTLTRSGAVCSPACGTISTAANHATYFAPANVPQPATATVTAISVADSTKSAYAVVTVISQPSAVVSVSVTPALVSVVTSGNQQFNAVVQNDSENQGVTWTLTQAGAACIPACGSLIAYTTQTAIYSAPTMPPNPSTVTITATSLADNSRWATATIAVGSMPAGGSDQWVDITKYGARSVPYAPTATAACTSGSAQVTLSNGGWPQDFSQFENGDSIRLDNCGSATTMTPPTGVSVSPGMNAGGTPAVPVLTLGATKYSYQVIACDKTGGCSSASTIASTESGATMLGRITAPISRMSLSNNIMTVTTGSPHGFKENALVYIQYFSTHTASFEGWYIVANVSSPTTFTFTTSIDSRIGGTPTLDTSGGTVVAFNCNVVSWNAVTDAWKYFIYGRNEGTASLIGIAEPGTTSWQDYGAIMMANYVFPSFVPETPPTRPLNQYLLATIVSGGGNASIAINMPSTNTIANVSARMGSDAAILAAFKDAQLGTLFIPKGTYQIAGYLDLHTIAPVYVAQGGILQVADTIQIPSAMYWRGIDPNFVTQFQESPTPVIQGMGGSYPTMYLTGNPGGQIQFDHVAFHSYVPNGILHFYADSGVSFNFDYVQFSSGESSSGYMNRHFIFRTGAFDYNFSKCLFIAAQEPKGDITDIGYTFLPSALFAANGIAGTGSIHFKDTWFVGKSAVELNESAPGGDLGDSYNDFENTQTQNDPLPVFIASNYPMDNSPANRKVFFNGFSPADFPSAMTGNWAAGGKLMVGLQNLSNLPTGSRPLIVGNLTQFIGQDGATASSGTGGGWFATGGAQLGYLLPPPASAPLISVGPGGAVPVGSHTYEVAWTDAFGNSTTVGPSATVNIVSGMQSVTVTPSAAPAGAQGWQYYRDGALQGPSSNICGPYGLGTSSTDTLPFPACGNSAPYQNTASSSGEGINGLETTQIELTGGGHKSVIAGTFTADRTLTVPDFSGTIAVTIAKGTVSMPTDAIAAGSCGVLVTTAASGVLSTDVVRSSHNSDPGMDTPGVRIHIWPTANNINFQYCNTASISISPAGTTLSWQVIR